MGAVSIKELKVQSKWGVPRDRERERWDRAYWNPNVSLNTAPNAFLSEVVKTLKPGRALEIGMG